MTPSHEETIGNCRLILGDCREVLSSLPAESVHCCVTSPPYYGLRDYGVEGQIGLEPTPEEYVARIVEVFREVRRVLRNDGTLWLVIGDCYSVRHVGRRDHGTKCQTSRLGRDQGGNVLTPGLKPKDLIGIPWRVAFALQDDGWYLRRDIIWHKPNPMPESVADRCTTAHEYLFMLTKSAHYYYDGEAIKEPAVCVGDTRHLRADRTKDCARPDGGSRRRTGKPQAASRNKRSVWTIPTAPFRGAHFATFPPALIEPCILASTSERGACPKCGAPWERILGAPDRQRIPRYPSDTLLRKTKMAGPPSWNASGETIGWRPTCSCKGKGIASATVIDPFGGAATTALTASRLGRSGISIELSAAYHAIACGRVEKAQSAAAAA